MKPGSSAPIGALISQRSKDYIKDKLKDDTPLVLKYDKEDYDLLYSMYIYSEAPRNAEAYDVWMYIQNNLLNLTVEDTVYKILYRSSYNKPTNRPKKLMGVNKAVHLIYNVSLKDVPLYINDEIVSDIAKWRLQINK